MAVPIVSRKAWGAKPWRSTIYRVPMSEKDNFLVHYHGGRVRDQYGVEVPRNIEAIHLANGWSGIGYNFAVDLDGTVYEGRGWDGVGSQCPGFNRSGVGVYVAVGGDQVPTQAALRSVRALRDDLVRMRGGAGVREMGHKDGVATSCPGTFLYKWVHSGMPLSGGGGMTAPIDTTPDPEPAPAPKPGLLVVDGKYGPATVKARQRKLGTVVDGVVSNQTYATRDRNPGLRARSNWEFNGTRDGSKMVRADQKRLAAKGLYRDTIDGLAGPNYWTAVQKELGTYVDGVVSEPSNMVKEMQRRINAGKY